jgi:hypothetical protein
MENVAESRLAMTIHVDKYFHIVTTTNGTIGKIINADVVNQMKVLNDSFRSYGFTFTRHRLLVLGRGQPRRRPRWLWMLR